MDTTNGLKVILYFRGKLLFENCKFSFDKENWEIVEEIRLFLVKGSFQVLFPREERV